MFCRGIPVERRYFLVSGRRWTRRYS